MPKEIVYGEGFRVEVRWSRDSYVQLATVMPEPRTSDEPQNLAELMSGWGTDTADGARGLYSTLGRTEINDLIRILRRARDQAFGRDE
jgi:hypothetical protein